MFTIQQFTTCLLKEFRHQARNFRKIPNETVEFSRSPSPAGVMVEDVNDDNKQLLPPQEHRGHRLLCSLAEHGEPPRRRVPQLVCVGAGGDAGLHAVLGHVPLVLETTQSFLNLLHGGSVSTLHKAHTRTYDENDAIGKFNLSLHATGPGFGVSA